MIKKIFKHNKKSIKILNKSGFRVPYQILVDSSFIQKLNKYGKTYKHITEIFKTEPKLYYTKCIQNEYQSLNKDYNTDLRDHCEYIKCKHENKSDGLKCIRFILRKYNKNHYIIGTANPKTVEKFKERQDVPILNFYKGQIKIYTNIEKCKTSTEYITEATVDELKRLDRIFATGGSVPIEIEDVDINELEASTDEIVSDEHER